MGEIYVMCVILYGLAVIACSQRIIQRNAEVKANRQKEELETHNLHMKMLKMQKEKEQIEGNNRCKNISIKELL